MARGWPTCSTGWPPPLGPRPRSACGSRPSGPGRPARPGLVSGVIASVVVIYVVLNRSYLAPFGTPVGQVVLAAVCALWFLSFWALVRLAAFEPGPRLLAVDP